MLDVTLGLTPLRPQALFACCAVQTKANSDGSFGAWCKLRRYFATLLLRYLSHGIISLNPRFRSLRLYLLAVRFTRTLIAIGLSDVDSGEAQDS